MPKASLTSFGKFIVPLLNDAKANIFILVIPIVKLGKPTFKGFHKKIEQPILIRNIIILIIPIIQIRREREIC